MFTSTTYVHAENDYRREQLRRAFRPLVALRAAQDLTRDRIRNGTPGTGGANLG
jgi:hypothetical protein